MMRCYFMALVMIGFSSLTACGGLSSGAWAPDLRAANVRPLSDVLYSFAGSPDGAHPYAGLLAGKNGEYYGTTADGGSFGDGAVYETTASGKEQVLYSFQGRPDGSNPLSTLTMDKEGALYGTTEQGGAPSICPDLYGGGCGTVFKLTPGKKHWTESVLYQFHGADGGGPLGRLLMTKNGALLGSTKYGGEDQGGDGVIFKLTPSGSGYSETVLHRFPQGSDDGFLPTNGLVSDRSGNLYGTTSAGGIFGGRIGWGTIFKLAPSGSTYVYSVIYRFKGGADGKFPDSSLLPAPHGVFYGLTDGGGAKEHKGAGFGTVFELVRSGRHYRHTVLYRFKGGNDGSVPDDTPGLVADRSGNLYGTTVYGGNAAACPSERADKIGCGTVFKLAPSASGFTESVLYAFQAQNGPDDGANPWGGVIIDRGGNLLGTSESGGTSNNGTIFSIAP
jgi:hypothetical protein